MLTFYYIFVPLIFLQCVTAEYSLADLESVVPNNSDGRLEFCEFMNKYNYSCYKYEVTTKDGFILTLFNVPGDPKKPVLLQHGFLDSSFTWVIRGYDSLAASLANNTYDLWFGNTRGNMLSRAHTTLSPDSIEFWDFSFHEMALYDMPAMIDFILEETGQTKLQVIGHSQGTQLFYVLGSLKPEYCLAKIKIVVCLAPIAFLDHAQQPLFPLLSLAGGPLLSAAIGFLGRGEFLRNSSELVRLFRTACTQGLVGYTACGVGVASVLFGSDPKQFEPEFLPTAFSYYPSGSSMKNTVHLAQIVASKKFRQYDYGVGNLRRYGSLSPPEYDLSKVPCNISLFVGKNDRLSAIEDAIRLWNELNEDVKQEFYVIPYKKWNHIDFVWGRYMKDYLFKPVLETLEKYY